MPPWTVVVLGSNVLVPILDQFVNRYVDPLPTQYVEGQPTGVVQLTGLPLQQGMDPSHLRASGMQFRHMPGAEGLACWLRVSQ